MTRTKTIIPKRGLEGGRKSPEQSIHSLRIAETGEAISNMVNNTEIKTSALLRS